MAQCKKVERQEQQRVGEAGCRAECHQGRGVDLLSQSWLEPCAEQKSWLHIKPFGGRAEAVLLDSRRGARWHHTIAMGIDSTWGYYPLSGYSRTVWEGMVHGMQQSLPQVVQLPHICVANRQLHQQCCLPPQSLLVKEHRTRSGWLQA